MSDDDSAQDHSKPGALRTIGTIAWIAVSVILFMYLVFPVFLAWPFERLHEQFPDAGIRHTMQPVFIVPRWLVRQVPAYESWLAWQSEVTGVH